MADDAATQTTTPAAATRVEGVGLCAFLDDLGAAHPWLGWLARRWRAMGLPACT